MTLGPWYPGDSPTTDLEVHVQRDGSDIDLSPYDNAEALLFGPDGAPIEWLSTPSIDDAEDVVIIPPPTSSPFAETGYYRLYVRLTATAGGVETFFAADIRVIALGGAAGWATLSDVRSVTSQTVDDDSLYLAQDVIEIHCGRTYAGSVANASIKLKDLTWLKKAVCYQAAWQVNQPGYLNRHSIKEVNQDGAQIIYAGSSEPNNPALIMLAPLANRALKNLSWFGNRAIKFKSPNYEGDHPSYGDYKRDDDHGGWEPM